MEKRQENYAMKPPKLTVETDNEHNAKKSRKGKGILIGAGATAGAVALAAGAVFGVNSVMSKSNPNNLSESPDSSTSSSESVVPTGFETIVRPELSIAPNQTAEQVATNIADIMTTAYNMNTDMTLEERSPIIISESLGQESFYRQLSALNADYVADELFVEGWRNNDNLVSVRDAFAENNYVTLNNSIISYSEDLPVFKIEFTPTDSVMEIDDGNPTDGSQTYEFVFDVTDNSLESGMGFDVNAEDSVVVDTTLQQVGDKMKISEFNFG